MHTQKHIVIDLIKARQKVFFWATWQICVLPKFSCCYDNYCNNTCIYVTGYGKNSNILQIPSKLRFFLLYLASMMSEL